MVLEHQKPEDGLNGESSVEALEVAEANIKVSSTTQINARSTLPSPPLAQCTKLQVPASYHPTSDSNFAALSSLDSPTSTMNHTRNSPHGEKSEQSLSIIPYNQQLDSSPGLNVDSLSPGWDVLTPICYISPSGPSPSLPGSSTSKTEQAKIYYTKMLPHRDTLSGVSLQHCSTTATHCRFGEGKFIIKPAAAGGPHYNLADETPDILKDVHSPIQTVKASSPKQKRVSPPKKMLHEAGSSFSPGLKSGRKYVLHSIPHFPSLTPYRNNSENKGT